MSEIVKGLWGKLYAWALPSAVTLGVFFLFVYSKTTIGHPRWLDAASETEKTAIFVGLTAVIAFLLNTFSLQLYRILEGYLFWPRWLQDKQKASQLQRKRELEAALAGSGWMHGLALERLARYPLRDDQVTPTTFGNAIRAFETYGKTRFNLDSQTLWYELCAVAPKYIQTEIDSARSSVDFLVASIYLSAALGVVTFAIAASENFDRSILVVCILAFFATLVCHWLVGKATRDWGYTVQALVNISRVKLADGLGLQLPESLDEEKTMWRLVTSYVFSGSAEYGVQLDRFRKKLESTAPKAANAPTPSAGKEPQKAAEEPDRDAEELQDEL